VSLFAAADAFFNRGEREWTRSGPVPRVDGGVYADDFTLALLDAIECFYTDNSLEMERRLAIVHAHPWMRDRNNEDKVRLLAARVCDRRGDHAAARLEYEFLMHHPFFGKEAQDYLR